MCSFARAQPSVGSYREEDGAISGVALEFILLLFLLCLGPSCKHSFSGDLASPFRGEAGCTNLWALLSAEFPHGHSIRCSPLPPG
jgi:hypothetical protein